MVTWPKHEFLDLFSDSNDVEELNININNNGDKVPLSTRATISKGYMFIKLKTHFWPHPIEW